MVGIADIDLSVVREKIRDAVQREVINDFTLLKQASHYMGPGEINLSLLRN